jgi:hypothetical protein
MSPGPISDSYQGPPDLTAISPEPSMPWGIQKLVLENKRLRAALEPFAREADKYMPAEGDDEYSAWDSRFKIGELRRARNALTK